MLCNNFTVLVVLTFYSEHKTLFYYFCHYNIIFSLEETISKRPYFIKREIIIFILLSYCKNVELSYCDT